MSKGADRQLLILAELKGLLSKPQVDRPAGESDALLKGAISTIENGMRTMDANR
jgi:hypothetical protein